MLFLSLSLSLSLSQMEQQARSTSEIQQRAMSLLQPQDPHEAAVTCYCNYMRSMLLQVSPRQFLKFQRHTSPFILDMMDGTGSSRESDPYLHHRQPPPPQQPHHQQPQPYHPSHQLPLPSFSNLSFGYGVQPSPRRQPQHSTSYSELHTPRSSTPTHEFEDMYP